VCFIFSAFHNTEWTGIAQTIYWLGNTPNDRETGVRVLAKGRVFLYITGFELALAPASHKGSFPDGKNVEAWGSI
jgi:hypothetical protein